MGKVITFLSGKGGTGKTALCAAVAAALAKSGEQVLCIDGDMGLGNLDLYLGIGSLNAISFWDVYQGSFPLTAALVHPQYSGLSFLAAPTSRTPQEVSSQKLADLLREARKKFDYILIDGPSGIGPGTELFARPADRCVLTTLPDPASLQGTVRAAQVLEGMKVKNTHLVVNRVYSDLMKALGTNIDGIMDQTGLPLLGVVPSDPNVSMALCKQIPLLQYSRFGACGAYKRIARRLQGQPVPVAGR